MQRTLVCSAIFIIGALCSEGYGGEKLIDSVQVVGNRWPVVLDLKSGDAYDAARIEKEVRRLWDTGRFEDIQVETAENPAGTGITFKVKERQRFKLNKVVLEPQSPGIQVKLEPGTPLDYDTAQKTAVDVRRQLHEQGFDHAHVDAQLVPLDAIKADLKLQVDTGPRYRVHEIRFSGNLGVKPDELKHSLRAMRIRRIIPPIPGLWAGFRLFPTYSQNAVDTDVNNIKSFLYSKGYFDARVQPGEVSYSGKDAVVNMLVESGPQYRVNLFELEGAAASRSPVGPDGAFSSQNFCRALFQTRRQAERAGILDFTTTLNAQDAADREGNWINLRTRIDRGPSYTVGRIEFRGNHALSDGAVRRMFKLDEGVPFDQMLLRRSLARLNQSGFFDNLSQADVSVQTNPETHVANLFVKLKEKKRGRWYLSGPVGPMSFAGPLQFSIASRLPAWGQGIFELSTYFASFSIIGFSQPLGVLMPFMPQKTIFPLFSLERPFFPGQGWTSGFVIAPQLGWEATAATYGTAQIQHQLGGLLQGDRGLTPDLTVLVSRNSSEQPVGAIYCQPPKQKLWWLRTAGGMVVNFLPLLTSF